MTPAEESTLRRELAQARYLLEVYRVALGEQRLEQIEAAACPNDNAPSIGGSRA